MSKTTGELVQIAAAGGGMRIPASGRTTAELVQIAAAASSKRALIYITGAGAKTTGELVQIGAAGKGCVVFEL